MLNMSTDHSTLVSSGLLLLQVNLTICPYQKVYASNNDLNNLFEIIFDTTRDSSTTNFFRIFKPSMVESMLVEPATT